MSAPSRPPPIPRRHPSRPSMSATFSSSSISSSNGTSSPEPVPALPSTYATLLAESEANAPGRRGSHDYLSPGSSPEQHTTAPAASPSLHRVERSSMVFGAAAVGLGPVLLDFKDWVKAGQAGRDGSSTVVAGDDHGHERKDTRSSIGRKRDSFAPEEQSSVYSSNPSAEYDSSMRDSYMSGYTSSSSAMRSQSQPRNLPNSPLPSSHSMSSLSIDSSHSPQFRSSSRADRFPPAESSRTTQTNTPRRSTHDILNQHIHSSGRTSRGSNRLSLQPSPMGSPNASGQDSPSSRNRHSISVTSPLERRFSRRLANRRDSSSNLATEPLDEETEELHHSREVSATLDDRIREAEEKLAKRASLRQAMMEKTPLRMFNANTARLNSPISPPQTNGRTPRDEHEGERNGSARAGRRQPIPAEFQNGRLFTPSPNDRSRHVDLTHSNSPRPLAHRHEETTTPSRSLVSARSHSVLEHRESPWARPINGPPRSSSRADIDQFNFPRQRETPRHNRPESVLMTSAEHTRYHTHGHGYAPTRSNTFNGEERSQRLSALLSSDRDYASRRQSRDMTAELDPKRFSRASEYSRDSRDFSSRDSHDLSFRNSRDLSTRGSRDFSILQSRAIGPNDSVSVAGGPSSGSRTDVPSRPDSARKDPLEMIRRLEETRTQHNRRWEEDRAASALGDSRSSRYGEREMLAGAPSREEEEHNRPGSRLSRLVPRPASSMSSVRDSYLGMSAPRTAPQTRRRTDSGSSTMESPLHGRTSRASGSITGPSTEPRIRRSMTSLGERSGSSDPVTDHSRNLVDAVRVLETRLGQSNPDIVSKLTAAASGAERANAGVRAAVSIAQELAIDVEIDDESAVQIVKERLPRLAVTLREAGRASDQAVRNLTDALLAARGTNAATTTPARAVRRSESVYTPRDSDSSHRRATTISSPLVESSPLTRHSPSLSTTSVHSPLTRFRAETPQRDQPMSYRNDSGASATSSGSNANTTGYQPRALDPIEQSPPKPPSKQVSPDLRRSAGFAAQHRSHASVGSSPHSSPNVQQEQWNHTPKSQQTSWSAHNSPVLPTEQHSLRKQSSLASTHTVRPNSNSFLPSHPPEPTTALSSSPAYSSIPLTRYDDEDESPQGSDVLAPLSSPPRKHSAAQDTLRHAQSLQQLNHTPSPAANRESVMSVGSVYSNADSVTSPVSPMYQPDVGRMGTFGAAQGSQLRASVSERFRKHLNGE